MKRPLIVLNSTGAISDMVIASALIKPLESKGYETGIISTPFTHSLWNNLGAKTFANREEAEKDPADNWHFYDISDYIRFNPHSTRMGHLANYMAYAITVEAGNRMGQKTPEKFLEMYPGNLLNLHYFTGSDHVRVSLTEEEATYGRDQIHALSTANGNKPVVILSPYATTKNRNLPKSTLETVVRALGDTAVFAQLTPFDDTQKIAGTIPIGDKDLRKATAFLLAVDAFVGVDSGPLHMINGALQGTEQVPEGIYMDKDKVIACIGSSYLTAVCYTDNRVIIADSGCEVAPCGAHGYQLAEKYTKMFSATKNKHLPFYHTTNEKDKSGCIFPSFPHDETAPCMASIYAESIVVEIKKALAQSKR